MYYIFNTLEAEPDGRTKMRIKVTHISYMGVDKKSLNSDQSTPSQNSSSQFYIEFEFQLILTSI